MKPLWESTITSCSIGECPPAVVGSAVVVVDTMVDNESTPEGGIADGSSQAHADIHKRARNPKRLWTAEEDQNIVRMREQGACWRVIADYYSCRYTLY